MEAHWWNHEMMHPCPRRDDPSLPKRHARRIEKRNDTNERFSAHKRHTRSTRRIYVLMPFVPLMDPVATFGQKENWTFSKCSSLVLQYQVSRVLERREYIFVWMSLRQCRSATSRFLHVVFTHNLYEARVRWREMRNSLPDTTNLRSTGTSG